MLAREETLAKRAKLQYNEP